jgi:hypothetical protein
MNGIEGIAIGSVVQLVLRQQLKEGYPGIIEAQQPIFI